MSRETLAEHIGVSYQQVSQYERGADNVSLARLVAIARALRVSPTYFYIGLEGLTLEPVPDDQRMRHFRSDIAALYRKNKKHFAALAFAVRRIAGIEPDTGC